MAGQLERVLRASEPELARLRMRVLLAASKDRRGGVTQTGVRWWLKYCLVGRQLSPIRLPVQLSDAERRLAEDLEDETMLMDFVMWLVVCKPSGRHISARTAQKYVSSIQAWHERCYGRRIGGGLGPVRMRALFKGLRREVGPEPKRARFGVRTQDLQQALARGLGGGSPLEANWRALLATAFCALMRGGEVALQDGEAFDATRHLTRADVSFFREAGVLHARLRMRVLKSERDASGKYVTVTLAAGGTLVDPVTELWRLLQLDPVAEEERAQTPLFRGAEGCAFTVAHVRAMVRSLMGLLGRDPSRFGAHSLRIGGATAALAAGISPTLIRLMGRWSSDVYEIYTRMSREAATRCGLVVGSTQFYDLESGGFTSEELEILPGEVHLGDADLDGASDAEDDDE